MQYTKPRQNPADVFGDDGASRIYRSQSILGVMRWRRTPILLSTLLFALLALAYLVIRTPSYTAQTQLLVYNAKLAFSREDALFAESQLDPTFLETQIEILKSDKIALDVVNRLGLAAPQEAQSKQARLDLRALLRLPSKSLDEPKDESEARRRAALQDFEARLSVERVGLSYVVAVSYTASDPEFAARAANETARAYVADQDAARVEAAQSASAWLRERIRDLGPRTRIIAPASPPANKSSMSGLLVLAIAMGAGFAIGVGIAFSREFLDHSVRTPEQAIEATDADCFGIIPKLRARRRSSRKDVGAHERSISDVAPLLSHAIDHPLLPFWNTLRHVKAAADVARHSRELASIGVTSTYDGEGKTTTAANLARLIASMGERVVLIDANPHDGALSRTFSPRAGTGLIDFLESGGDEIKEHVWLDPRTGMHFLPVGGEEDRYRRSDVIWSAGMTRLLERVARDYDFAVFDLPPLASPADLRAAAELLNHILLVIHWGQVTEEHVEVGLASTGSLKRKLLGTVLNNVDVVALKRLASPAGTFLARGAAAARSAAKPIMQPVPRSSAMEKEEVPGDRWNRRA